MNSEKTTKVLEQFSKVGIIPVVVLNDTKDALPLGNALMKGGLPAAEVTFRTDAAEESIKIMSENFPDMLVGAGTVLTIDQVDRAVGAGAKFIVSPGLDENIVNYCLEKDIPVCPGVQTPSEITKAVSLGLDHVKFFPAEPAGGLKMISAVKEYLQSSKIFCCGGSWMVKGDMIKAGDFETIEKLTAEAAGIVKEFRG